MLSYDMTSQRTGGKHENYCVDKTGSRYGASKI
jgi:hypothetical protein